MYADQYSRLSALSTRFWSAKWAGSPSEKMLHRSLDVGSGFARGDSLN